MRVEVARRDATDDRARRGTRARYAIGVALATASLLAGCTSTPAPSAAQVQVKKDWVAFFSPSTPATKKVSLLEDGAQFAPLLGQLGSMAASVSSTVQKVKVTSADTATVTFSILLSGTPVLSGQRGEAVKQSGTWKVSDEVLCGLLSLESKHPAACSSTSS